MAVMTVYDANELKTLNRKQRTHMSVRKGSQKVNHVIFQEGIPTFETFGPDNALAEPVIYLLGEQVIGGFYRVHHQRGPIKISIARAWDLKCSRLINAVIIHSQGMIRIRLKINFMSIA